VGSGDDFKKQELGGVSLDSCDTSLPKPHFGVKKGKHSATALPARFGEKISCGKRRASFAYAAQTSCNFTLWLNRHHPRLLMTERLPLTKVACGSGG
jgi:hypothetical protein